MSRVVVTIDDERFEGDIVSGPTGTGLLKIRLDGGKVVVRHVFRVTPLDQDSATTVGGWDKEQIDKE